jgi:hypothetical protein
VIDVTAVTTAEGENMISTPEETATSVVLATEAQPKAGKKPRVAQKRADVAKTKGKSGLWLWLVGSRVGKLGRPDSLQPSGINGLNSKCWVCRVFASVERARKSWLAHFAGRTFLSFERTLNI